MEINWKDKRQLSPIPTQSEEKSIVTATDLVVNLDGECIKVFVPVWETYELFLSIAEKCGTQSKECEDRLFTILRDKNTKKETAGYIIVEENESHLVYDVFECHVQMVVFSVIALEAFANNMIPYNYSDGKRDKKSIERYEKLKDKYLKLLPLIYDFESPKDEGWLEDFEFMIEVRDNIVHYKHNDKVELEFRDNNVYANHDQESVYITNMYKMFRLAQKKPIHEIAKEIMEYYKSRCDIEKYKQKKKNLSRK